MKSKTALETLAPYRLVALVALVALASSGDARGATLDLGVTTDSTCSSGGPPYVLRHWTSCGTNFLDGVVNNAQSHVVSNAGTESTLSVDAAVTADAGNSHGDRVEREHQLGFRLAVQIQVGAGVPWTLQVDQSVLGLFARLEDGPGAGGGQANVRFDINQDISVFLSGAGDIDLEIPSNVMGGTGSDFAREFMGQRTDFASGVGDAVLTGWVRTQVEAISTCFNDPAPCVSGDEYAVLLGIDNVGGALAITADDYVTWDRESGPDGYEMKLTLLLDSDADGAFDGEDNCPDDPNPDQRDTDGDLAGDVCDEDDDDDGILDTPDNCPLVANPDQNDLNGDLRGDACTRDFSIVKIVAPKKVTLSAKKPVHEKLIKVLIQNQSPRPETIVDANALDALVDLTVEALHTCPDLDAVPNSDKLSFPLVLRSKKKLAVRYLVSFGPDCVPDPSKSTKDDPSHHDYRFVATVDHAALDGEADTDPADDTCPRIVSAPHRPEPNPNGRLKDKGCGSKLEDKTFGGEVRTDVVDRR